MAFCVSFGFFQNRQVHHAQATASASASPVKASDQKRLPPLSLERNTQLPLVAPSATGAAQVNDIANGKRKATLQPATSSLHGLQSAAGHGQQALPPALQTKLNDLKVTLPLPL